MPAKNAYRYIKDEREFAILNQLAVFVLILAI